MNKYMAAKFAEGRHVEVSRKSDGGVTIEWSRPDPDNGLAYQVTRIHLSRDAFHATAQVLSLMVLEEIEDEKANSHNP